MNPTIDPEDEPRPVTGWDYVAAGVWLIGFGALLGAMFTMWILK